SARLAHQVRTPLGAAVLYLSQLQPLLDGYGDAERYIAHGLDRLRDLERLVNDMLLFAGGIESSAEPIELESLIDDVVDTFAPQQNDPFRICWTGSDTPITVLGSRHALRNAVSNLLANALQFTPGDDHVVVSLSVSDRMARIAIRDHGPGVPEEFKDRVFEPFFSTQSAGTGLGLAVVQAVACAHDGRILVNDYPDGAEFVLELPLAVPAAVLEAGSAGIAEPTHV
ncbi:MAG: HAMP domain-containing sensor histidine kinase, partial [Pseudomonadota bacterium]